LAARAAACAHSLAPPFPTSPSPTFPIPCLQPDDSLQQDLLAGRCPLGRPGTLLTLDKPQASKVIGGKAENATFHVDVENGGWVRRPAGGSGLGG
jgi:hypothetical protein